MIIVQIHLTKSDNLCIIIIGNGETTNVVRRIIVLTHLTREGLQMCPFIGYLLLQSIFTSVIIKVRAMIVIPINE